MRKVNFTGSRRFWTRERVLAGLKFAADEITGPLPCRDSKWSEKKKGRYDWPPARRVLEFFHSMARGWLAAGVSEERVSLSNIDWTREEEEYLLENAGERTLEEIGRYLGRTYGASKTRLNKEIHTTARANQGMFSAAEIAKEYGCPYHRIRKALQEGKINGQYDRRRNRWQVDIGEIRSDVMSFLQAPKVTHKNCPTDLGDYYQRHGLIRKLIDGKLVRLKEGKTVGVR